MPRAGLSPQRLAEAGAELADEVGFAHVTPSALARRLGVSVPSLYAHVAGAQDLRTRICLHALDELAERTADAVAGRSGRDALAALGQAYRDFAHRHPGRWQATLLNIDPQTAAASAGPRLARLSRAVLHGYGLAGADETHAVRLVGSTLRGFVDLEAAGGFDHSPPDPGTSWSWCVDALDALLRAWPPSDLRQDDR